jgi:hypothetical protein
MFNDTSLWEILLWSFLFFIWIAAIMIWIRIIIDVFKDHTLSGWGKAGWTILLIFLPWLGAFIYLIARGKSMNERQMAEMAEAQKQQAKYIQDVAGAAKSPAEQIADAKGLLDSGAITQAEFDAMKAKALA